MKLCLVWEQWILGVSLSPLVFYFGPLSLVVRSRRRAEQCTS